MSQVLILQDCNGCVIATFLTGAPVAWGKWEEIVHDAIAVCKDGEIAKTIVQVAWNPHQVYLTIAKDWQTCSNFAL